MFRKSIFACGQRLLLTSCNKLMIHTSLPKVLCYPHDKFLPSPHIPTPVQKIFNQDSDILLEELKKAQSSDRILELTSMHLDVMNSNHIVACLDTVHRLIRIEGTELPDLIANLTFQALCTRLMKVIRVLDSQDLITVYKTLAKLGVQNNSFVMNSVLKMLGSHLNDMTLAQLTFLNYVISKQRHNALVDGLRMALPLVLQVQIDQQLDSNNLLELSHCLQMACKARLKISTIEKVISALLNGASNLIPETGVSIIFSLLRLQAPVNGYKELINLSFDIVAKYPEQLNIKEILNICKACRFQGFYHHGFLHACAGRVLSEKWNLENCFELVSYLYLLGFTPPVLIDYLSELICCRSTAVPQQIFPLNLLEYFTATGHQPKHVDKAVDIICSWEDKISSLQERSPHLMLKFVSCLAILGHFPQKILSKVINDNYLFEAWSISKKQGRGMEFEQNLFSLLWGLDVFNQKETFQVPLSVFKKACLSLHQRYINSEYPLAKFIENGLGGAQFLHSGIYTWDGHVIDHVLVMRSGNYPVSLHGLYKDSQKDANPVLFVEDILLPEDAKIIAVIVAQPHDYMKDPEVLTGAADLKIKSLAKRSYSPVVINFATWKNLPDREKIPYLMREIKQTAESVISVRTSSFN